MIALVMSGLVVAAVLAAALRRAPLLTLLGVAAVGLGLHSGVVSVPAPIAAPVRRADASLRRWQHRQSVGLGCEVAVTDALLGTGHADADAAVAGCAAARTG